MYPGAGLLDMIYCFSRSTSFKEQNGGCYNDVHMMKFFTKKNKAAKKWHSRAMIIDVNKTRVTFSGALEELIDMEESNDSAQASVEESSLPSTANVEGYQNWF